MNLVVPVHVLGPQERGLCLPYESRSRRRPRTLLFSTASTAVAALADRVFHVENRELHEVAPLYIKHHLMVRPYI